jgi:PAS domain S-box-containing protein
MDDRPLHILVVEDNSTDLLLLEAALEEVSSLEFTLTHAKRLDEALERLADEGSRAARLDGASLDGAYPDAPYFDAVLLDLGLPDSQGLETFARLQREHPAIPILIVSGLDDETLAVQAVQGGAQDFVVKGKFQGNMLVRTIRYAIERKRTEQKLIASEMSYRRLFETAEDGIFILDAETGQITDANPFLVKMLGYTVDELLGKRLWEVGAFRDKEASRAAFATLQEKGYIRYDSLPLMSRDGNSVEVEFVSNVYMAGAQQVIQCNIRDIAERKQAEAAVQESRVFLQSTLDALGAHIAVLDESGVIVASNKAWRQFFLDNGGTVDSCGVGANYIEVCDRAGALGDEAHGVAKGIRDVMAGHQAAYRLEYSCHSPGEERWFTVRVTRFVGEGLMREGLVRVVIAHEDITERKQVEQALEARTREIVTTWESMTDAFFSLDTEWRFTHINSQAAHLWQRNVDDLIGKIIWEEFPASVGLKFDTEYRRALKEHIAVSFEAFYPPDKAWREVHAYPSRVGLSVYFRDITERKLQEEQLHFQKTLLEAQAEASPDGILLVSNDGELLSFNQRYVQIWNIPPDVVASADNTKFRQVVLDQVADSQQVLSRAMELYEKTGERNHEEIFLHDGRVFDRYSAPITSPDGSSSGRVWYFRDITENKQAENALRASEERFQSIVANVPGMVYQLVRHPDGSLEWPFVSRGSQEIFEIEPQDLRSSPSLSLEWLHPDDRASFDRSVEASMQTLLPWSWEGRRRSESGEIKWIQGASRPQRLPDGGTLWNGLLMDVTARKEAEEQRDRFFTLSLDLLGIAGKDGYFKRLNPAFSETLGFSEAELLAKPFMEFVHPDDRESTLATVSELSEGASVVGFENRYLSKDGSWRWLEWKSVAVREEGLIYAAARDVTQRKNAENALLQMRDELEVRVEERTAALKQSNEDLQIQIEVREGAEAETRTRARQQEAVAELGQRALTEVDFDTLSKGATALVTATLDVELSTILELMPDGENLCIRAGAGWDVEHYGYTVPCNDKTMAGYTLVSNIPTVIHDLRSETRFEPPLLLVNYGIVSGVTVIIGGYEQPYGTIGAHTVRQRNFSQDDVNFLQAIANVLAAAFEQRRIEAEIRQLNAQLKVTNEQLKIENMDRQMAMGALREVTVGLERAKEEAEQSRINAELANRAKSEFLSRMSHELRTPLNAILGFGQILEMHDLSPKDTECVDHILKAGTHLLGLINEVLDISGIEAGRITLTPELIRVSDIVSEALNLVRPLSAQRDIIVVNEVESELGWRIMADRQRLKQVLLNILGNAVKYNRKAGKIVVFAELRASAANTPHNCNGKNGSSVSASGEERLRLNISDTGYGLSAEELARLFVPFERLGAAQSGIEGTGIGLALSRKLVEVMDGTMGVESTVGTGSVFWIEFPLAAHTVPV